MISRKKSKGHISPYFGPTANSSPSSAFCCWWTTLQAGWMVFTCQFVFAANGMNFLSLMCLIFLCGTHFCPFGKIKFYISLNEELFTIAFCFTSTFPLSLNTQLQSLCATKRVIQYSCVLNNINSKASLISHMSAKQEIDVFKCAFIKWLDFPKKNVCHLRSNIMKDKTQNT